MDGARVNFIPGQVIIIQNDWNPNWLCLLNPSMNSTEKGSECEDGLTARERSKRFSGDLLVHPALTFNPS